MLSSITIYGLFTKKTCKQWVAYVENSASSNQNLPVFSTFQQESASEKQFSGTLKPSPQKKVVASTVI